MHLIDTKLDWVFCTYHSLLCDFEKAEILDPLYDTGVIGARCWEPTQSESKRISQNLNRKAVETALHIFC